MTWSYDKMVITSNQFIYDLLMEQERHGIEKEVASLAEGQQQGEQ